MTESKHRLTRRRLLRSTFVGGSGLLTAYLVGCGSDEEPRVTATLGATLTLAPGTTNAPTPIPTPSPTPSVLQWDRIETPGAAPSPRRDHSMVSDGNAIYVFGGRGPSGDLSDLWAFDLATGSWREIQSDNAPPARFGHSVAYSTFDSRMVIFGGQAGSDFLSDTWAFTPAGEAWEQLQIPGDAPLPRYGSASAYDPVGRLIVSHGFTSAGRFDDTWAFSLSINNWSEIARREERPVERCLVRGVWDTRLSRFMIFGGQSNGAPFLGDLWAFNGAAWEEIELSDGPRPRNLYAMAYDAGSTRVLLFGGATADGPTNDTWFLDANSDSWSEVSPGGESPPARSGHDAVWLPEARGLYVFGGRGDSGELDDLWRLFVPLDEGT